MKVWLATYTHRHGTDNRIFKKIKDAQRWKDKIAEEYWDDEIKSTTKPTDNIGDQYFNLISENSEYFDIEELDVE
jgi:DNA-binding transcriptional regulator GbsR (MarR family)